ncbi:S-layer homology domain-containing protein [Paenibacillus vandeheii]
MNAGKIAMRTMKVWIAAIIVFISISPGAFTAGAVSAFPPDLEGHWAKETLQRWMNDGLLQGYPDGKAQPNRSLTRAEWMTLVNRAFGLSEKSEIAFSDVAVTDWVYPEVQKAVKAGYVTGYEDGKVRGNGHVSREEAAVMLARVLKLDVSGDGSAADRFTDAKAMSGWSKAEIAALADQKLITGYGNGSFKPKATMTRAEAVVLLDASIAAGKTTTATKTIYDKPGIYGDDDHVTFVQGDVIVRSAGVTLRNMRITGTLTLAEEIGEGDAHMNRLTVQGDTIVRGGGANSIHFTDCTLSSLIASKSSGSVRLVAEGSTSVINVRVESSAILEAAASLTGSGFSDVKVNISSKAGESAVVKLMGAFNNVSVATAGVNVELATGSIKQLTIEKQAQGVTLTVGAGTRIALLNLNAVAKVLGQGTIAEAILSELAKGTAFEKQPSKVSGGNGANGSGNSEHGGNNGGNPPTDQALLLSFPVMSDTHVGIDDVSVDAAAKFKEALTVFKQLANYDAVVVNGDLVDSGKVEQYDTAMSILNENKIKGAKSILVPGNHEYYASKELGSDSFKAAQRFYDKTGMNADENLIEAVDPKTENAGVFYDTWVKGYHFIVMDHDRSAMSDAKYKWLEEKISTDPKGNKADPTKPVFVFTHYPYKDTTYGSEGAGWKNPTEYAKFKTVMAKHPNAMTFTGHTHYTLEHPNTINADDGFIRVNDGATAFVQAHGSSNEGDIYLDKKMSQGLLVKVYDDKLIIERRELDQNGVIIGEPYKIDLKNPVTSAKQYSTDNRNPEFPSGAKLMVSSVAAASARFTWPKAQDDTRVDHYEITVNDKLIGAPLVISPYVEAQIHSFAAKGLKPDTEYTVSLKAVDAFGKSSQPITSMFKTVAPLAGYDPQQADVLDMDFNNVTGNVVKDTAMNQNDAVLENNAKVLEDAKFGKSALVLDGAGSRGTPSSVARVTYNSSLFKQAALTIETAFYISPDSDLLKDEYHIVGNYENGGYYLYYSAKDKKFVFDTQNSDDPAESDEIVDVKGKIFYLTAVYDGDAAHGYANGSIKLYVNGVLVGSNKTDGPLPINETNDLIIGGDVEGYGDVIHLFDGVIDHVKLYSRALTAEEVAASYNAPGGAVKLVGGHDIVLFKDEIAWMDVKVPGDAEAEWTIPENGVIKEDDDNGNRHAIKALASGVETVLVASGDGSDTANVTVVDYNVKLTLNAGIHSTADLSSIMAPPGKSATNWSSLSPEVATIDSQGIVTARMIGNTVISAAVDGQTVRTRIIVDPDPAQFEPLDPIDITNRPTTAQKVSLGAVTPAVVGKVLQKEVSKYAKTDPELPQDVKDFINGVTQAPSDKMIPELMGSLPGEVLPVDTDDVKFSVTDATYTTWLGTSKGVVRINQDEANSRDVVQLFATHRYLPDDDVQFIVSDNNNGVWAVTGSGVSHIAMVPMGYEEKAQVMSDNLEANNLRRGSDGQIALPFLSEGSGTPGNRRGSETDNDGLWTADAIAGELFRTAVEEAQNPDGEQAKQARERATRSVEADLLLMYVTGRAGQIESKIRMLPYSTMDVGSMSYSYLRADGSKDNPDDYVYVGPAETEKRTVQGFISRTMGIDKEGFDEHNSWDGIFYKKGLTVDGQRYSYNTTDSLADPTNVGNSDVRKKGWGEFAGSVINSANDIPPRLAKLFTDLGATEEDLYYKGDTSADEILGHMYLYKIAYDTLCTGPNADHELGELIANAAGEFARHIINNGYTITDITGQPTVHGKYTGYTFGRTEDAGEDTSLRAAELMTIFKTAAYVTGNDMFLDEYRKVARDYIYPSVFENEDAYNDVLNGINGLGPLAGSQALEGVEMPPQNGFAKGYMQRLNQRWASYYYASRRDGDPSPFTWYNYSDERQAMFTFYNLVAIPDKSGDEDIAVMIRKGLDNWYKSNMQYEDEPLWDYIYQLAYPEEQVIDVDKAAWVLKRTPIDRTDYYVNLTGRKDISWFVTKAITDADDGYNNKVSDGGLITEAGIPAANGIVYDPATGQYVKQPVKEGDLFVARTRRQEGRHVQSAVKDDPTRKIAVSPDERPLTRPGDSLFGLDDGGNEQVWDYGNAFNAPYWMARYYGMLTEDR